MDDVGGRLLYGLFVGLRHMHFSSKEGAGHGAFVAGLLPETPPHSEFFRDHRVQIQVLGNVKVLGGRILEGTLAVTGEPYRRVRLLVRLGPGEGLLELPILAFIDDTFLGPRLPYDSQCLLSHIPPLIERQVPPSELVLQYAYTSAELETAP